MTKIVPLIALALVVAACSSGSSGEGVDANTVSGVVTEVTGNLEAVDSFVVLDDDGNSHLFRPEPGLLFYGGPLSHLRDHVVTGQRVTVTFEDSAYGERTATLIEHEDESSEHEHGDHSNHGG